MRKMLKNITIVLAGANLLFSCKDPEPAQPDVTIAVKDTIEQPVEVAEEPESTGIEWKEIKMGELGMVQQIHYADTTNFMHRQIYPCAKCFLRPEAAPALMTVNTSAMSKHLKLVLFDCYRPKVFQQKMYDMVQNPDYVAEPVKGSMHNRGLAVDIALADSSGVLLEFGTPFDDFTDKAHYDCNDISAEAKNNRKLLRDIMVDAGFTPYKNEWWHFNYTAVKYPVDDFVWNCN